MKESNSFLEQIAAIPAVIFCIVIFFGPGLLCWQMYKWLKTGRWSPVPVSMAFDYVGLPYPNLEWRGVQKILDYLLDLPLSAVSFVLAVVLMGILVALMDSYLNRPT